VKFEFIQEGWSKATKLRLIEENNKIKRGIKGDIRETNTKK
jgi:hypothetical protein